jgi:hypothetical protein
MTTTHASSDRASTNPADDIGDQAAAWLARNHGSVSEPNTCSRVAGWLGVAATAYIGILLVLGATGVIR